MIDDASEEERDRDEVEDQRPPPCPPTDDEMDHGPTGVPSHHVASQMNADHAPPPSKGQDEARRKRQEKLAEEKANARY